MKENAFTEQSPDQVTLLEEENRVLKSLLEETQSGILHPKVLDNLFTRSREVVLYAVMSDHITVEAVSGSIAAYGYAPEAFSSGKLSLHDIIYPDDWEEAAATIVKQTGKGMESFEQEYRMVTPQGEVIWVTCFVIPEYERDGCATHFLMKIKDISKRKQYENELQEANKNLFVTLKSIGEAVVMTDAEGYIERLNDAAEMMVGIINAKAKRKLLLDVMRFSLSENFDTLIDPLDMEAETCKMMQYDIVFVQCGYEEGHFRASCTVSPIYGGKYKNVLTGHVLVVKDLTAVYDILQSARESDSTMRSIFDHSVDGIFLADSNGIIREWSNSYENISGIPKEEAIGKGLWEVVSSTLPPQLPGEERDRLYNELKATAADMQQRTITRYIVHQKTGKLRVINVLYFPVTMPGKIMLGAIARDVTREVYSQELLRQHEEKLQESNNLLQSILKTIPAPLYVKDVQGTYVECNDAFPTLFGLTKQQVVGKTATDLYPDVSQLIRDTERQLLGGTDNAPHRMRISAAKSEMEFIVHRGVLSNNGETTGIVGVMIDITDLKKVECELIRAKEKAEEADKLKSAFLANMSHEIRTPLNGIVGFLKLLANENLTPERRREYIAIANNSSMQLVKLIDDIIDLSKIEAKQMTLCLVPFHINNLMYELQMFFETFLHAKNRDRVTLVLDTDGFIDSCVALADPVRLRQVLTNLLGNAVKFTEKGYIRFGYRQSTPDLLNFFVEDTGIGIPGNQIDIVFRRFARVDHGDNRLYSGTGLGLPISKSLVQMMGGDMYMESTEGAGSTFHFTIAYRPCDTG